MNNNFRIAALAKDNFSHLFNLNNKQLSAFNAKWFKVDSNPGFPCRISLQDAEVGEKVLAVSYIHHNVSSPYKASGPIFVRENCVTAQLEINSIPKMLNHRHLSVRAYDENAMMVNAKVLMGVDLGGVIQDLFDNKKISYLHLHNAIPGCFNCSVLRE